MKIYLRDRSPQLVDAWTEVFKGYPNVKASCGDIFRDGDHLDVDAIVSPANSFGFMDGGIDFVYSDYFGWGIGDILREKLWTEYNGELLVGQAVAIDMRPAAASVRRPDGEKLRQRADRIPWLISAPTMRVPANVSNTVNAFLAFRAALRCAKENNFSAILCPGLATAIGQMPPRVCAVQMFAAYKEFENPAFYDVLGNAHQAHYSMMNADTYIGSRPDLVDGDAKLLSPWNTK
jgi:O-acetyl-ADP-ribose deacetylase (regulator of RNase III)